MTKLPLIDLALFSGVILLACLYGLTVAGHFPAAHRSAALRTPAGTALLWGSIAATALAVGLALAAAWTRIPWSYGVLGAGATILASPLLLQPLPDSFVDGRRALFAFSAGALLLAVLLRAG